ncbi:MAG: diguanylate cyclase [Moraxellaceae bacterium]
MSTSKNTAPLKAPMNLYTAQAPFDVQSAVPRLSERVLNSVRDQVEQRRLSLHFAQAELEQRYMTQRAAEYREVVRLGWPMLLIVYVMILGMSLQFYPEDMFAYQGLTLWLVWLPLLASLLIGVFVPTRPRWLANFEWIVAGCGMLVLVLLLLSYFFAQTADYADHAMLNTGLMLLIMAFASRIRVWLFGAMLLFSSATGLLIALFAGVEISWLKFGHLAVLYGAVILFVMALIEAGHRLAFLQELLLTEQGHVLQGLQKKLDSAAREDLLSGLPNRRSFDDIFRREWERTRRDQQELSLLYIDLDYFNLYNDNYGAVAGDAVLQQVAQLLRECLLRPADQACRYSGESFVLILPNTNTQGAIEVARRIIQSVDRLAVEHRWSQVASHITVSVGIATSLINETDNLQLLIRADDALYQAKRAGRHRLFVNG